MVWCQDVKKGWWFMCARRHRLGANDYYYYVLTLVLIIITLAWLLCAGLLCIDMQAGGW